MERPTTEIAVLPLLPGANLADPKSEGSGIWRDCVKTTSTYMGFQHCLYNVVENNSNTLIQLLGWNILLHYFSETNARADWESMAAHQAMIDSPGYGPFLERVGVLMADTPDLKHTVLTVYGTDGELSTAPSTALKDTATVIEKFYFPLTVDSAAVDAAALSLVQSATKTKGSKVAAKGWLLEQVEHKSLASAGKVLMIITGWENIENASTFSMSKEHKDTLYNVGAKADEGYVVCF
ncbi:hypothetical protein ACJ41O_006458 [Fusarium nematophilum]